MLVYNKKVLRSQELNNYSLFVESELHSVGKSFERSSKILDARGKKEEEEALYLKPQVTHRYVLTYDTNRN